MSDKTFFYTIAFLLFCIFNIWFSQIALDNNYKDFINILMLFFIGLFPIIINKYKKRNKEKTINLLINTIEEFLEPFKKHNLIHNFDDIDYIFNTLNMGVVEINQKNINDYSVAIVYNNINEVKQAYKNYFKKPNKSILNIRKSIVIELKRRKNEREQKEYALNNSPLYNYFKAIEGGETTFYYLKLQNKFGERRYKFGVTLSSVKDRYANKYHSEFEILYEKKLTHARSIETQIKQEFAHLITDESLIGTTGTEIVKEDILKMDIKE